MESQPHITLFSAPFLEPSKLNSLLKAFALKHNPLPLTFSSVATFPNDSNNLLFLAPTPFLSLLHFQSQLCDAIRKEGIEIADEYAFNSWIPYCSVVHHVPKNRMPEAFSLLRELKLSISSYVMDVALVQFSSVREIFLFVLGNNLHS